MIQPTIVIAAYNRPQSLNRLLENLCAANYPPGDEIQLCISIDRQESQAGDQVRELAQRFTWPFGEKKVIVQAQHIGLVEHFLRCCNLTDEFEAIIFLEDDLYVSPMFYHYATQALNYYQEDEKIAGVSLYTLWFNGYNQLPFIPIPDDSDVFFLQVPYTQGQAFTRAQWERFRQWHAQGNWKVRPGDPVHEMFLHFDEEDWFPTRMKYLAATNRYYVFPRESLSVGFGDAGTHFAEHSQFFQVPIQRFKQDFRLKRLEDSFAVYDSFFEILPDRLNRLAGALSAYSYDVDLYGTKSRNILLADYVLTSRSSQARLHSYGKAMWPMEMNVIEAIPGEEIRLCRRDSLKWGWTEERNLQFHHAQYFSRRRRPGLRQQMLFYGMSVWENLRGEK